LGRLIPVSAVVILLLLVAIALVLLLNVSAPVLPSAPLEVVLMLILVAPRHITVFIAAALIGQVSLFAPPAIASTLRLPAP
jgi:hypothetical protein